MKMDFAKINNVYFLGIGGIGMSALARYFHINNKVIGGYDLSSTALTSELSMQGMQIHFDDSIALIPEKFKDKSSTLIVITPAVPADHSELNYFQENNFTILKRAQVLGLIFNNKKGIAIAGTHGKTSVTTFTSFLLSESGIGCNAFLGGISKNFNSNLVLSNSEIVVAEADEFDRSFLQLYPDLLLVTTVDSDHLDIYKDINDITNTFNTLLEQVKPGGIVILNETVKLKIPHGLKKFTYSLDNPDTDFYASGIKVENGFYTFTLHTPDFILEDLYLEVPGKTNVENAIAALAINIVLGAKKEKLQKALPELKGVVRRFDIKYKSNSCVYIDDYAHHPRELDAVISSVREMYPNKKLTVIFQPHLFSRTRDFAIEFAESLSKADELILLDIYPAREKPLPGVTSNIVFDRVSIDKKQLCSKINLLSIVKDLNIEVLLTTGAGDIDQYVDLIKQFLATNEEV
jgi:UDP-N-acetylmuramate--alanine ligase